MTTPTTTLGPDSRLAVSHLVVRREDDDEYVVGDPANGNFVVVPELGARLIELFAQGRTVAEAAEEMERETGEPIDALDFAEVLVESGVVDTGPAPEARSWSVSRVPARLVRWLFGRTAWTVYIGCLAASIAMFVAEPSLLPTYEDTFVFPDIIASLLLTNVVVIILTIVHEIWHALAGAAAGVRSQIRIERRGIFPVLETDLTGLWGLPPSRRYGPFLAGMAIDSVVLFVCVGLRFAWSWGWLDLPPGFVRFLAMVVFSQVVKLAFQTLAYLRTDMYLVMATATGCRNLHQVTRLTLKRLVWRLTAQESIILRDAHPRDVRVSRWYRLLYLAGVTWMIWFALHFLWPSAVVVFGWSAGVLADAPMGSYFWWEALALIAFAMLNVFAPLLILLRNKVRERRAAA